MEFYTTFPKSSCLMYLWIAIFFRTARLTLHFGSLFCLFAPHLRQYHPILCFLDNFQMIFLSFKVNGDVKPSGSYTELHSHIIPAFVAGLSFRDILNLIVSVLIFHNTLNDLSFCTSPLSRSLMLFSAMFLWNWFHYFNLVAYELCRAESCSLADLFYLLD